MLLLIRLVMVAALAWAMVCFALYGWTARKPWRTRGLRAVLGTLAAVMAFA